MPDLIHNCYGNAPNPASLCAGHCFSHTECYLAAHFFARFARNENLTCSNYLVESSISRLSDNEEELSRCHVTRRNKPPPFTMQLRLPDDNSKIPVCGCVGTRLLLRAYLASGRDVLISSSIKAMRRAAQHVNFSENLFQLPARAIFISSSPERERNLWFADKIRKVGNTK